MFKTLVYATVATIAIGSTFDSAQAAMFSRPSISIPPVAPRPMVSVARPAITPAPTAGLTKTTTITQVGRYTEDTTIYKNQSGRVVMATSSIAPTVTNNMPAGALAPTGLILGRDQSGNITSVKKIGGPAPAGGAPISTSSVSLGNKGSSANATPGFGGSGLSQNTTNSKQAQQGQNITNTPPSGQAHQGKNCTVWLHQNGVC
jgi:hypothetical protein